MNASNDNDNISNDKQNNENTMTMFGHSALKYFNLRPSLINLNHGSYGTTCNPSLKARDNYYLEMEADNDEFIHNTLYKYLGNVRKFLLSM